MSKFILKCATPGCSRRVRLTLVFCCDACADGNNHSQSCAPHSQPTNLPAMDTAAMIAESTAIHHSHGPAATSEVFVM